MGERLQGEISPFPTPRELDVLRTVLAYSTEDAAGDELGISPHTLNELLRRLYRRLDVTSRTEAVTALLGRYHLCLSSTWSYGLRERTCRACGWTE